MPIAIFGVIFPFFLSLIDDQTVVLLCPCSQYTFDIRFFLCYIQTQCILCTRAYITTLQSQVWMNQLLNWPVSRRFGQTVDWPYVCV